VWLLSGRAGKTEFQEPVHRSLLSMSTALDEGKMVRRCPWLEGTCWRAYFRVGMFEHSWRANEREVYGSVNLTLKGSRLEERSKYCGPKLQVMTCVCGRRRDENVDVVNYNLLQNIWGGTLQTGTTQ
jgi:hypothetical protein